MWTRSDIESLKFSELAYIMSLPSEIIHIGLEFTAENIHTALKIIDQKCLDLRATKQQMALEPLSFCLGLPRTIVEHRNNQRRCREVLLDMTVLPEQFQSWPIKNLLWLRDSANSLSLSFINTLADYNYLNELINRSPISNREVPTIPLSIVARLLEVFDITNHHHFLRLVPLLTSERISDGNIDSLKQYVQWRNALISLTMNPDLVRDSRPISLPFTGLTRIRLDNAWEVHRLNQEELIAGLLNINSPEIVRARESSMPTSESEDPSSEEVRSNPSSQDTSSIHYSWDRGETIGSVTSSTLSGLSPSQPDELPPHPITEQGFSNSDIASKLGGCYGTHEGTELIIFEGINSNRRGKTIVYRKVNDDGRYSSTYEDFFDTSFEFGIPRIGYINVGLYAVLVTRSHIRNSDTRYKIGLHPNSLKYNNISYSCIKAVNRMKKREVIKDHCSFSYNESFNMLMNSLFFGIYPSYQDAIGSILNHLVLSVAVSRDLAIKADLVNNTLCLLRKDFVIGIWNRKLKCFDIMNEMFIDELVAYSVEFNCVPKIIKQEYGGLK